MSVPIDNTHGVLPILDTTAHESSVRLRSFVRGPVSNISPPTESLFTHRSHSYPSALFLTLVRRRRLIPSYQPVPPLLCGVVFNPWYPGTRSFDGLRIRSPPLSLPTARTDEVTLYWQPHGPRGPGLVNARRLLSRSRLTRVQVW